MTFEVEVGKLYYWRDIKQKKDNWGRAEGFDKYGNVILKDTQGEIWVVPEDELIEW